MSPIKREWTKEPVPEFNKIPAQGLAPISETLPATAAELDYMKNYKGGGGLTGMGAEDLVIPRIKLLQGLSPELTTFEAAKSGEFWHNVLNVSLGKEFRLIICSDKKRYLLSAPLGGSPEGILASSDDAVHWNPPNGEWDVTLPKRKGTVKWKTTPLVRNSGLTQFGSSDPDDPSSHPAAVLFYDYVCYLPDYHDLSPVLLSLSRSQLKPGKSLNSKVELRSAQRPMQGMIFKATCVSDKGPAGPFNNYAFYANGDATQKEYETAVAIKKRFGTYKVADEEGAARGEVKTELNDDEIPF